MFLQLLEGGPTFDLDTSQTLLSVDELNVTETVSLFMNSFTLFKSNSAIAYILQYCIHMQNVEACKLATLVQETTNAMNQVLFLRISSLFNISSLFKDQFRQESLSHSPSEKKCSGTRMVDRWSFYYSNSQAQHLTEWWWPKAADIRYQLLSGPRRSRSGWDWRARCWCRQPGSERCLWALPGNSSTFQPEAMPGLQEGTSLFWLTTGVDTVSWSSQAYCSEICQKQDQNQHEQYCRREQESKRQKEKEGEGECLDGLALADLKITL